MQRMMGPSEVLLLHRRRSGAYVLGHRFHELLLRYSTAAPTKTLCVQHSNSTPYIVPSVRSTEYGVQITGTYPRYLSVTLHVLSQSGHTHAISPSPLSLSPRPSIHLCRPPPPLPNPPPPIPRSQCGVKYPAALPYHTHMRTHTHSLQVPATHMLYSVLHTRLSTPYSVSYTEKSRTWTRVTDMLGQTRRREPSRCQMDGNDAESYKRRPLGKLCRHHGSGAQFLRFSLLAHQPRFNFLPIPISSHSPLLHLAAQCTHRIARYAQGHTFLQSLAAARCTE